MAATNISPQELLGYVPLTKAVKVSLDELPKPLPSVFYDRVVNVPGDSFRRFLISPTRKTARKSTRGAPPRRITRTGISAQDVKILSSKEEIAAGPEIFALFHPIESYEPIVYSAANELKRQSLDAAVRIRNLETASIQSAVANAKLWFSVDDEILGTSSGAVDTIDLLVPAGNFLTSTVDWSSPSADIVTYLDNILTFMMINGGGRRPTMAIYGKNVMGYLSNNTSFQQYLARNPEYNQYYVNNRQIKSGTLGLEWVRAQDSYYQKEDGTFVEQFPVDQITFMPDPTEVYELKYGSEPVPTQFMAYGGSGDLATMIQQNSTWVYGPYQYALWQGYPTMEVVIVNGTNFFPDFTVPGAVWIVDTKP